MSSPWQLMPALYLRKAYLACGTCWTVHTVVHHPKDWGFRVVYLLAWWQTGAGWSGSAGSSPISLEVGMGFSTSQGPFPKNRWDWVNELVLYWSRNGVPEWMPRSWHVARFLRPAYHPYHSVQLTGGAATNWRRRGRGSVDRRRARDPEMTGRGHHGRRLDKTGQGSTHCNALIWWPKRAHFPHSCPFSGILVAGDFRWRQLGDGVRSGLCKDWTPLPPWQPMWVLGRETRETQVVRDWQALWWLLRFRAAKTYSGSAKKTPNDFFPRLHNLNHLFSFVPHNHNS